MKILALVSEAFAGFGGISQFNQDLLKALCHCTRVEEVRVLPRICRFEVDEIFPGIVQESAPGGRSGFAFRSWQLCRQQRYDLILCGHINLLPLAGYLARKQGVPVWLVLHGIDAWQHRVTPGRLSELALVTAVSRYTLGRFREMNPIDPSKLKVLPNTVNPTFTPGPKSLPLLDRHGLLESDVLLTVGRLNASEKYKGQDRVISVMPQLLRTWPNLAYVIVGEGDDRERLESMANTFELGDHVKFVDQAPDSELVQWYRSADVFAMPSNGEGFGIVFLQAAACGLRVVGGNCDGSVDALRDGQLGRMVDPMDADRLQRAISDQLELATSANAASVGCFSFPNFQQQVELLLDYLVEGREI